MTLAADRIDKVVLLLVSGLAADTVLHACVEKLELSPDEAAEAVAAAQTKITLASNYDRQQQIGKAVTRLEDLYGRALRTNDVKTALGIQRETSRLLQLYGQADADDTLAGDGENPDLAREAAEARTYLASAGLGRAGDGLAELARLAVAEIARLHLGQRA